MSSISLFLALVLSTPLAAPPKSSLYDAPLQWVTEQGQSVELGTWKGKPVVLALVYSGCSATCPLTMQKLKRIEHALKGKKRSVEFVVVSLDPERDTPEALARFREKHQVPGKNWHFLRGSLRDTRQLAMLLNYRFDKNPESGQVMHDNKMFVLSSAGELLGEASSVGDDVAALLDPLNH